MDSGKMNWLIHDKFYLKGGWLFIVVGLLSILGLQVRGRLQDHYIGCFGYIDTTSIGFGESNSLDYELTIEKCILKCRNQRQTYSALQNGTICHCVTDHGDQLPDDACHVTCAGNQLEYCGGTTIIGNNKTSILSTFVVYAVCPVGNYGSDCDKFCHCKRQIPCSRLTGYCPDGCDGNYTGRSCNITTPNERYIGCYEDKNRDRALPHWPYAHSSKNTLEMCIASCADANYSYAGAQYSSKCFCGENYNKHGKFEETRCGSTCSGNYYTYCGGSAANSIYSVCPVGRYGNGCREKCNCLDNKRCVYLNGSCPLSQCQPGWTGNSCNIRDCGTYNGNCLQNEKCSTVDLKFSNMSLCRCSKGFRRRRLWADCTDKDECLEIPSVCGQIALNCSNTIGGYQCLCPSGETRLSRSCMTEEENDNAQKAGIVEAILGSMCCLFLILVIIVLLYKYRKHQRKSSQDNELQPKASAIDMNPSSSRGSERGRRIDCDYMSTVEDSSLDQFPERGDMYTCLTAASFRTDESRIYAHLANAKVSTQK